MDTGYAYGCLFCRTGSERAVADRFNEQANGISAVAPIKVRKRYHDGECAIERVALLPGYVFFRGSAEVRIDLIELIPNVHRVLQYADDTWQLKGFDEEFAVFFFENSEIEYSKAEFIDGRIHFLDGFLKGHDDDVIRLNKRMKTAEVKLEINHIGIWAGYEVLST